MSGTGHMPAAPTGAVPTAIARPGGGGAAPVCLSDAEVQRIAAALLAMMREQGWTPAPALPLVPAVALMDARGAAAYLRMSRDTFDRRVRRHVNAVDTGGHLRYRREDLDAWAAERSRPVPPRGCTPRSRPKPRLVTDGR